MTTKTLRRRKTIAQVLEKNFSLVSPSKKRILVQLSHKDISLDSPYLGDDNRPKLKGESDSAYLLRLEIPELVQSILSSGQQTPGLVLEYSPGKYILVYGFRRYHATREAGVPFWAEVLPAGTPKAILYMATLSENAHRKNLNPSDMCRRCARLYHDAGLTIQQISVSSGYSTSTVEAMIKTAKFPEMLELLRVKSLSVGTMDSIMYGFHYSKFTKAQREDFKNAIKRATVRGEDGKLQNPKPYFVRHVVERISQNKPVDNLQLGRRLSRIQRFPTGRWLLSPMSLAKSHVSQAEKDAGIKDLRLFLKEWESRPVGRA